MKYKNIKPKFDYDKESDVMYITFGKAKPCRSVESQSGIVIRYHPTKRKLHLNGITIIDYSKRVLSGSNQPLWECSESDDEETIKIINKF